MPEVLFYFTVMNRFLRQATLLMPVFFLFLTGCTKEMYVYSSFHEPADGGLRLLYSKDGYHWNDLNHVFLKPEVGDQKIMRDPSVVKGPDGTYHMVWTSGWKGTKGFGYASSKDMIHWTPQRNLEVMYNEPSTVNVWAPELFYDDVEHQFIIIWASTIPHRFPKGQEDENNNHRMYYTTTKDFNTFSPTKLFFDPGFSVIDCVILKEAKDKYVLVLKDNTRPNRNIKVAFSNKALGPYTNVSAPFTDKLTEGPSVVHPGKEWLIYFDSYGTKTFEAVKTYDFKTFSSAAGQIGVPEGHKHGTIFKMSAKQVKALIAESKK